MKKLTVKAIKMFLVPLHQYLLTVLLFSTLRNDVISLSHKEITTSRVVGHLTKRAFCTTKMIMKKKKQLYIYIYIYRV